MKRVVQSKVTAECAFEIIKREVQRKVAAECRYHNIYDEIMKRVLQSKVTACVVQTLSQSKVTAECAFEIINREVHPG